MPRSWKIGKPRCKLLAHAVCVSAVVGAGPTAVAQLAGGEEIEDFTLLDIEALMQIEVTSVAGREQALIKTPAALYVITAEDMRRTGVRQIAEALRLVPGFTVGRISPSTWAVGSRGFADRFANDLLVRIDGRTVYDPIFSGTFWNVQDVLIEDLDRIEVVRGPGATLWGANAVNGVVNITTKDARDTLGLYVTGGVGTIDQGFGAVRYGASIGEDAAFRISAKYDNFTAFDSIDDAADTGDWDMFRGAFRFDWGGADELQFTLQGDVYTTGQGEERVRVAVPGHLTFARETIDQRYQGGNVLFRVGRRSSDTEGWSLQTYYDRTEFVGGQPGFESRRDTADIDYRQYRPIGNADQHVLMWGLGYRHTRDRTQPASTLSLDPRARSLDTFAAFAQLTLSIVPDRLTFMIGSKFEDNDVTDFEYQPSGRLSWTPDDRQIAWGSISRAVRTPSRTAEDVRLTTAFADTGLLGGGAPSGIFAPLTLVGDPDVDSEELIAYELGYRAQVSDAVSLDLAAFYDDYDQLITLPRPAGSFGNRGEANVYGFEVASQWTVSDNWRLAGSYSFIRMDMDSPDSTSAELDTPQQQFKLQSYLDVTEDWELNTAVYYVDEIPGQAARDYTRLDVGMTWRPHENVEIAVWGQNLLDGKHFEFGDDIFQDVGLEIERSVYAQLTLRF